MSKRKMDIINGPFYGNDKILEIVNGYVLIMLNGHISNDIITMICNFIGKYILLFNVYEYKSNIKIITNIRGIFVNKDMLYVLNYANKLYVYDETNDNFRYDISKAQLHTYFSDKNIEYISQGMSGNNYYVKTLDKLYKCDNKNISKTILVSYDFKSELKQIKCGANHSLFLTENGNVYGCGKNESGQLTSNYTSKSNNIIQCIINSNDIKYIVCCREASYVLDSNNKLKVFGDNWFGELGINDESIKLSKEVLIGLNGIEIDQLNCGACHIGCITLNNELYMYGYNYHNQCGSHNDISCHSGNKIILKK